MPESFSSSSCIFPREYNKKVKKESRKNSSISPFILHQNLSGSIPVQDHPPQTRSWWTFWSVSDPTIRQNGSSHISCICVIYYYHSDLIISFLFMLPTADPGCCWPGGDVCRIRPGTLRGPVHQDQRTRHPLPLPALQPQLRARFPGQLQPLEPFESQKPRGTGSSGWSSGQRGEWGRSAGRGEESKWEHWEPFRDQGGGQPGRALARGVSDIRGRSGAQRGADGGGVAVSQ